MPHTILDYADLKLLYKLVQWSGSAEQDPEKFFSESERGSYSAIHLREKGYSRGSGIYWNFPTRKGVALVELLTVMGKYLNDSTK